MEKMDEALQELREVNEELDSSICTCPNCNSTYYYNNRICYTCFGTGIKVNRPKDE